MGLTNQQYDSIKRKYEAVRERNRALSEDRRIAIEQRIPELKELEKQVASLSVQKVNFLLDGKRQEANDCSEAIHWNLARRASLLKEAGFTEEDLEPLYDCPDCKDTGYITGENGIPVKCHCFRDQELAILYDQSEIWGLISHENFSNLSYAYRTGEDLEHLQNAVVIAKEFVQNFDQGYHNLVFCGRVGTGKSFLSGCIADELLRSFHSVLYLSSQRLFDLLSAQQFGSGYGQDRFAFQKDLYSCDLLIIDDLGTELTNSFVSARLFECINERHIRQKSTIISTNLMISDIRDRYSERLLSRLVQNYQFVKLTGPDIRMMRQSGSNNQ